ncbi:MAG: type II secretion system protein N [Burkholderiaceae bacterium]|jgi:general secretion pathway protein N
MKDWLKNGALVLLGTSAVLLMHPPAHWLTNRLAALTHNRLTAVQVEGSLWRGQAQLAVADGRAQPTFSALPGALQWDVAVASQILRGRWPSISLRHENLPVPLQLSKQGDSLVWNDGSLTFPAQWLSNLGAPWNTIRPEGRIAARWQVGQSDGAFRIDVDWQDAQSALSVVRPLGQYRFTLEQTVPPILRLTLQTLQGPLRMTGTGQWSARDGWQFKGYAEAQPAEQAALTGLLSQMGRREGRRYRLEI